MAEASGMAKSGSVTSIMTGILVAMPSSSKKRLKYRRNRVINNCHKV
jgi:hypothetical protein